MAKSQVTPERIVAPGVALRLSIHCGCGAKFATLEEGTQHVASTRHKLVIAGSIHPEVERNPRAFV